MGMKVCLEPGCPALVRDGSRCVNHRREKDKARGTRTERGYTAEHDRRRREWAPKVSTGTIRCARCRHTISPTEAWHLDHSDDRTTWLGPSHATCNLSAGGRAAHHQP